MSNSIVPVHLVVKSMRDNGYKNTAYAVAELIDNSIQHGATNVDLICLEKEVILGSRTVSRIDRIAVLDNGNGMDKETLWSSLQFGNGTNLEESAQTGIGKFGMGLPSSSISQALRVDVWTWQKGADNAIYSYLDVKKITKGEMSEVPEPTNNEIPAEFLNLVGNFGKSGTLVVWSQLDRCLWKTGKTIIDHSEYVVGRMYRKFLDSRKCKINAIVVKEDKYEIPEIVKSFLPNDPLYLMKNTSVSKALKDLGLNDPMFVKHGGSDGFERKYIISYNNKEHEVYVRYSVASETTRKGRNAGGLPHGKHAKDNIGVSVLRAHRELYLDSNWTSGYDPRDRWWGVEIDFPPSLDDVFGVTNNKQYANNFRELGDFDIEATLKERGQTIHEFKEELIQDNDPKVHLIEIAIDIKNQIKLLMNTISAQAKRLEKDDSPGRHDSNPKEAEKHATEITKTRSEDGHTGESETKAEGKSEEEKQQEIENELTGDNVPEATEYAKEIFKSDLKYQFVNSNFESRAFFSVSPVGGKIIIKLNTNHPAYNQFVEILSDDIDSETNQDELVNRLVKAKDGMKLLLMAWARYEDEQPDGKLKDNVKDARMDWGKMASEFMRIDD
ncbi:ATP-binding protein [Aurantibacter aestuarii]|uniref:ATP-binding protein n=1 Tax=Aurantibacter aestuarii TaxID=1266046 RepID=A0A2T1N908_9FLAO|nr:ATP-binding protein [Aurantibacter aestuarii]PSG88313.1 ATP-binding protein [Aurantibacter aestuarii]